MNTNRRSVRVEHEDNKGRWVERVVVDPLDDPEAAVLDKERRKELAMTLGPEITKRIEWVLRKLPPNEGFIVLSRELYDMSNAELAALLYKTESNIRKTYSQGKHHLGEEVS